MAALKDLSVSFLSLVKTPATGKSLTLKSAKDGQRVQAFELLKTDDERMVAYGIVYAPDQTDSHGDTADAQTIRRAAYEFMREARLKNIDTEHSFNNEVAYVAESWLVRKGDEFFPDEPIGAWAVGIQIGDPDIWAQLKSGELTGISLAGIARIDPEPDDPPRQRYTEKDAVPSWFSNLFAPLMQKSNDTKNGETEMDKAEVQEIVRTTLKDELGDALKEALKSAGVGSTDPEPKQKAKEDDPAPKDESVDTAVAKAVGNLKGDLEDMITKAMAKGFTENDPNGDKTEESFA